MLAHLNLVGDGDEIAAIEAVEREFGIGIDTSDAGMWFKVGDVYAALLRSLPGGAAQPSVWERFCSALATESDDDPAHIAESTRLLMP
jgi:hypothetical protein